MNSDENVEILSRSILSEVQSESEQVKSEAQSKADAIREKANTLAQAERKAILEQAAQEASRIRSQAIATAQLKARSLELAHREKLLEQVFTAVRKQLPSILDREDSQRIIVKLISEAIYQLNASKAVIHLDKSTEKKLTGASLEAISKEMKANITLGNSLEKGTGVIVEAADGHLVFDNTFDTRLDRLQNGLRSSVYRLLRGESA